MKEQLLTKKKASIEILDLLFVSTKLLTKILYWRLFSINLFPVLGVNG